MAAKEAQVFFFLSRFVFPSTASGITAILDFRLALNPFRLDIRHGYSLRIGRHRHGFGGQVSGARTKSEKKRARRSTTAVSTQATNPDEGKR